MIWFVYNTERFINSDKIMMFYNANDSIYRIIYKIAFKLHKVWIWISISQNKI
jgi:mRNA-degrading endonuclease HigB of HigAB toxin-antitoxin module